MSNTKRLDEGTIRRFMKLANMEKFADNFVEQNTVLKEGMGMKKVAGGEEVEENMMEPEMPEGDYMEEAEDDMGGEDMELVMEGAGGGSEKEVVSRVIKAIGSEFPELGIEVEEGAGEEDMEEPSEEEPEMEDEEGEEPEMEDEEGEEAEMEEGLYGEEDLNEEQSEAEKKQAEVEKKKVQDPGERKGMKDSKAQSGKPVHESTDLTEAVLARVKARILAEARAKGKAMSAKEKMKMKKKAKSGAPSNEAKKAGGKHGKTHSKLTGQGPQKKGGAPFHETSKGGGKANPKGHGAGKKPFGAGGKVGNEAKGSGKTGNLTPAKSSNKHGV